MVVVGPAGRPRGGTRVAAMRPRPARPAPAGARGPAAKPSISGMPRSMRRRPAGLDVAAFTALRARRRPAAWMAPAGRAAGRCSRPRPGCRPPRGRAAAAGLGAQGGRVVGPSRGLLVNSGKASAASARLWSAKSTRCSACRWIVRAGLLGDRVSVTLRPWNVPAGPGDRRQPVTQVVDDEAELAVIFQPTRASPRPCRN